MDEKKLSTIKEEIKDNNGAIIETGYRREVVDETTPWSVFRLDDDATIKIKTIILSVYKTEKTNPNGEPIYFVKSQNIIISQNPISSSTEGDSNDGSKD